MVAIIGLLVIIGMIVTFGAIQKQIIPLQKLARGLLVSYFTLVLILALGEAYFRFFYAESDGLPTLASQNWLNRYWQTNTFGYRDREWSETDWQNKQTALIVGDSFTAGWGIENAADRFGDVLAAQLGDSWAVINLGDPGASTIQSAENLHAYPLQNPDVVVIQYYLNDIENAALSIGLDPGLNPGKDMPFWAQDSHLGNFIYWRLAARLRPETRGTQTYWDWLYSMYDNSTVWGIHAEQINALIDQVETEGAELVAVIFPNMLDPFNSIPYVDRVAQVFEARGYGESTIKLFDAAAAVPLNERIVSERDAHASAAFNSLVGAMLYVKVQELFAN